MKSQNGHIIKLFAADLADVTADNAHVVLRIDVM